MLFHAAMGVFCLSSAVVIFLLGLAVLDTILARELIQYPRDERNNFRKVGSRYVSASPRMIEVSFSAEKAPDTFRVFVLGGSQAMGSPYVHQRFSGLPTRLLGLSNEGGISTWLGRYLRDLLPTRNVEVINAAKGGGSLGDSLPTFEEIVAVGGPDLVIFLSGNNERVEDHQLDFEHAVAAMTRKYDDDFFNDTAPTESKPLLLYFLTVPTNVRDWLPHSPSTTSHPEIETDLRTRDWASVAAKLGADAGGAADPLALFARAKILDAAGDPAQAKGLYVRAKDLDREFARARSQWNDVVRGIRSASVRVLDLENVIAEYADDGIPGFDLFHDHCHFRLRTNSIVAYEIARDIAREMKLPREPVFLDASEAVGIGSAELRRLYLVKTVKWLKMRLYGGLSAVMGINASEVAVRYHNEERGFSAVDQKINAAREQRRPTSYGAHPSRLEPAAR